MTNTLGKLYSTLLLKRIEAEIETKNILSQSQAGFRKNFRTTDHIMTLFTLIKKTLKNQNKFLFACFVDFRKAYDSICRHRLIYKLKEIGLKGKILDIITAMYKSPRASLYYKGKISEPFDTTIGLKQGDPLSTLLFNLYINDLPELLNLRGKTSDQLEATPKLGNTDISSLLFADDLLILSLSKEDLQCKIACLENFCNKWGLELNLSKTKIMIFNRQGSLIKRFKFYFRGNELEITNQYTYLGFTFIPSGKKYKGIEILLSKASKAWFSIQRHLYKSKEKTINTYLHLYDIIVKPIAMYACECWGDCDKKSKEKIEKFQMSIYKQIMGVKKTSSNKKVLSELARFPLKIYLETQMFKYLQRFPFLDEQRYLKLALSEDKNKRLGWLENLQQILDSYGLSNLIRNIFQVQQGGIDKKDYKPKHVFFQKRARDCYIQEHFHSYLSNKDYLFYQNNKEYKIEKYLKIKNYKYRNAISKLRLSSYNLANNTAKWFDLTENKRVCRFCNVGHLENEEHIIFDCIKYKKTRGEAFSAIRNSDHIDLTNPNKKAILNNFFSKGSIKGLKIFGQYIYDIMEIRTSAEKETMSYVIFL